MNTQKVRVQMNIEKKDMRIIRDPMDIEKRSMQIISGELASQGIVLPEENRAVVLRAIHASADLEYARNLTFADGAVRSGVDAFRSGRAVITDTNMALSGLHKRSLDMYRNPSVCYMADGEVASLAKKLGTTRAEVSMKKAAENYPDGIYAIGNAPTALLALADLIEAGLRPSLVIGVPVGFVNVLESKDRALQVCRAYGVPYIIAAGRKGGSSIAAAILNAILYQAAGR